MAFTEVSGMITRVFYQGKGAEVTESFKKRDGSEGKKRWALWFELPHGLNEGDAGTWRGSHSDEVDDWTDKEGATRHTVKRSLNGAKPVGDGPQRQAAPVADDEPWAQQADGASDYSVEIPF